MRGFKCTDSNIQIPTSGLGQGGKVSLNAIVSSLLSPFASRASLSVAVAAGWRRQQRFPWLSRKTGSYESMKHHRGAEKQGIRHREGARESRHVCISASMCMWQTYRLAWETECIWARQCGCEWEKKQELDRGITHMAETGELEDFQHRVNGASYRPCALKIT